MLVLRRITAFNDTTFRPVWSDRLQEIFIRAYSFFPSLFTSFKSLELSEQWVSQRWNWTNLENLEIGYKFRQTAQNCTKLHKTAQILGLETLEIISTINHLNTWNSSTVCGGNSLKTILKPKHDISMNWFPSTIAFPLPS